MTRSVVWLATYWALACVSVSVSCAVASDWDEDSGKKQQVVSDTVSTERPSAALQGKVEATAEASLRIKRQSEMKGMTPSEDSTNPLHGKALDDELRGLVKGSPLSNLVPSSDSTKILQGAAQLQGGKGAKNLDPDSDDQELMIEWDRWRNRFLRAVQLGTQEILNNPDPDDYERPRVDPTTGGLVSAYGLGTSAAFSCQITTDGQVRNLEIISPSGRPKYDRAVLRAVQQLAGTQILRFPKGSHRSTVTQPGRITTANSNEFKYHHFGDVERVQGK